MSGRPVAAAVSSQRVSGGYAVEGPRERYVAEAPVGWKKRLPCTVRSLAIVEDAEEMKPTVVEVGVKASAAAVSWSASFPLVSEPEKAPVKPERTELKMAEPSKVAVPSTAKVEEAPKEPVTSKVEPKVEDAAVIMPTVVEVGVKASAPESWRVSFCLLIPPLKAPVTPERMPPKVAVPSTAKVEEAPKEPVTSKVEPKVEDAAETNPWSKNQELAVEEAER